MEQQEQMKDCFLLDGTYVLNGAVRGGHFESVAYLTGLGYSLDEACDYMHLLVTDIANGINKIKGGQSHDHDHK